MWERSAGVKEKLRERRPLARAVSVMESPRCVRPETSAGWLLLTQQLPQHPASPRGPVSDLEVGRGEARSLPGVQLAAGGLLGGGGSPGGH